LIYGKLYPLIRNSNIFDALALLSISLILFMSPVILIGKQKSWDFFFLYLFSELPMILLPQTTDFLFFVISFEFLGLCLYLFAALKLKSLLSLEGGIKYFVFGSIATVILWLGFSFLYGAFGVQNFYDLFLSLFSSLTSPDSFNIPLKRFEKLIFIVSSLLTLVVSLVFLCFLIKLGAAPFHNRQVDVYAGSSLVALVYFAILNKLTLFLTFFRLWLTFFSIIIYNFIFFHLIFFIIAFWSILVGFYGAWGQFHLKKFLAYSGIGNTGVLLLCLASMSFFGYFGFFFYLIVYIYSYYLLFYFLFLPKFYPNQAKELNFWYELVSFTRTGKFFLIFLVIVLFSLSGLPPLPGFWSKFEVMRIFYIENLFSFFFLITLFSILAALYYFRVIILFFLQK